MEDVCVFVVCFMCMCVCLYVPWAVEKWLRIRSRAAARLVSVMVENGGFVV